MTAVANIMKAIEALNILQVEQTPSELLVNKKMEKMTNCTTIANGVCSMGVKASRNFAQVLGLSIKTLLSFCDDPESDVRMIADECLNKIIRSTSDANVLKIQFELYNEIQRNGNSRCLRAALKRFGLLSHTIRPIKGKAYISNLIPCIVAISKRSEEDVIETLSQSLPPILKSLGSFMTDKDAKTLLKAFYPNLRSPKAIFRRSAGNMIVATCLYCKKPKVFLFYALRHLIDTMVSVCHSEDNLNLVVGIIGCIRMILPHVNKYQGSDSETDAHHVDCLIQVYELCLRYAQYHSDHNVVNAALETLAELLRSGNDDFVSQLTAKNGNSGGSKIISFPRTMKIAAIDSMDVENSGMSCMVHVGKKNEENEEKFNSTDREERKELARKMNIGLPSDVDVPLKYCCRYLASSFLLAGKTNELIPDKLFRVSVKSLALTCIGRIIRLYPEALLQTLEKDIKDETSSDTQMMSDILLFSNHPDPQLRGNVAIIIGHFLNSIFIKYWESYKSLEIEIEQTGEGKIIELNYLIELLIKALEDESATTCRQALIALEICLPTLLESEKSFEALKILFKLPSLVTNPYFLVKINLSKVLSQISYTTIKYLTNSSSFQASVIDILVKLLSDQDHRVRQAAANSFVRFAALHYCESTYEDQVIRRTSIYIEQYLNPLTMVNIESSTANYQLDQKYLINSLVEPFRSFYMEPKKQLNYHRESIEDSLSIIVGLLVDKLFVYPSKNLSYGCFETLSQLSEAYPTTLYPDAWDCRLVKTHLKKTTSKVHASNKSISSDSNVELLSTFTHLSPIGLQLLSTTISLLSSDPISLDLQCHRHMITLAGNLICGIALKNLKMMDLNENNKNEAPVKMWSLFEDREMNGCIELLFTHIVRLINIYVHVIDDIQVPTSNIKSALPSLPTAQSLSPRKKYNQSNEQRPKAEKKENVLINSFRTVGKESIGGFYNSAHYMKLHEILRAAHMNYLSSLEVDASQIYLRLLDQALLVLSQILDIASTFEARKIAEEILHYFETTLTLSPTMTVQCTRQLLKCLFGTNLSARWDELEDIKSPDEKINKNGDDSKRGLYDRCFQKPARQIADMIKSISNNCRDSHDNKNISCWSTNRRDSDRKMALAFKSIARSTNQKAFFASFIRIFETMVIKSLNQYTTTSSIPCQCEVLNLLSQLVQFHVNYCLLDTDKTFIDFVLGQFSYIEEGQINQVHLLLPNIFGFLVNLSYEKFHTKIIIDIREIIKLCDGLMASGQPPTSHCIPALIPVIEDIFLARSATSKSLTEKAELETTREYLMSMLLRLVEHHSVIELLAKCLSQCRTDGVEDGEEKWRKWSRMTMDAVLPALSAGKIKIESEVAGIAIIKLFSAISPTCFRPVDPLLKILFTVPPNLNEPIIKLERWLAMVNIILLSIICYAKEEAVLARLGELSIFMTELVHTLDLPDTLTIYDTADPLNATNVESCSLSPERIIGIFSFRVIFLASSKICLTLNSVEHREKLIRQTDNLYIIQELAFFLQLCIHMFESGSHCKVANATIQMLNDEELIPIEKLNSLMIEISMKNCPILTIHWTYLMTLLGYSSEGFWSKTLGIKNCYKTVNKSPDETSNQVVNIDTKIVRESTTILFCDHMCENINDAESLTWLVMNHIKETMILANESPVRDLVTAAVHRNPAASGLLVQAISARCLDLSKPAFVKKLLKTLESAHESQSGAVILALIPKFISLSQIILSKLASKIAGKKVEFLLSCTQEQVHQQLPKEDLLNLMEIIQAKKLTKKHGYLIGMINNLATRYYDISPLEFEHSRSFNPSTVKNLELEKTWFLSQIKLKVCNPTINNPDSVEAAQLLSNLDTEDSEDILMSKDFDLRILIECIKLGARLTIQEHTERTAFVKIKDFTVTIKQTSLDEQNSECLSTLYQSARKCLSAHVKHIVGLLPKPHSIYEPWLKEDSTNAKAMKYLLKFHGLMEDPIYWERIFILMPAVEAYIETINVFNNRQIICNTPTFDEQDLAKFALLCLEATQWMNYSKKYVESHELELCLNCATKLLKNEKINKIFGCEDNYSWVCSAASTLTKLVGYWLLPGQISENCHPPIENRGLLRAFSDDSKKHYARACLQMAELVSWLEESHCRDDNSRNENDKMPNFIKEPVAALIIIISRLELVNSFVLTPPLVWNQGWITEGSGSTFCHFPLTLSTSESNFLEDVDVLRQFVYRITLLGWTSRLEFEEIWMALLSVLSGLSIENNTFKESEGAGSSIQSISLAVQGITRLLTQTLILPHPGNPVNSIAIHHPRDPPLSVQKPVSKRLYIIQDLLSWSYQCARDATTMEATRNPLDLEHLFTRGNIEREKSVKGFEEFSYSQLSSCYIWSQSSLHEDKLPASVLTLKARRTRALCADCLDLDSCIRFLIELYSRWLQPSSKTPSILLNEVIRSIISISDLFAERGQFQWMFDTCSLIEKYHPIDDDIFHHSLVFAICKSAAILVPLDIESLEKIKRAIDSGLKTNYLPGRIATLQGMLFLLQSAVQAKCEETMNVVHPLAIKYVHKHIETKQNLTIDDQSEEHQRTIWALVFCLLEHTEDTPPDAEAPNILDVALNVVTTGNISVAMNRTILQGLERLIATRSVVGKTFDLIIKVALERLRNNSPLIAIPAFRLLLTCMYTEAADRFNRIALSKEEPPLPDIEPEALMRTIERTAAIFDRIKKGQSMEVKIFCAILSEILIDFFPPFETLTKVIGEFLSPHQPHQKLLSGVVFKVCERITANEDQLSLLQDWVLFSLPNFIQSLPLITSTWCLSCFFVSASTNKWLRALFPHIQSRMGKYEYEDKKILCIAAMDFYKKLTNDSQRKAFINSFEAAAKEPGSPFCDIIATFHNATESL